MATSYCMTLPLSYAPESAAAALMIAQLQVVAAALQALANMCKLEDVRFRVQAHAKVRP